MQHKHTLHKKRFQQHKIYRKKRDSNIIQIVAPLMISVLFIIALSLFTQESEKRGVIDPLPQQHNAATDASATSAERQAVTDQAVQSAPQGGDAATYSLHVTVTDGTFTQSGRIVLHEHPEWLHTEKKLWTETTVINEQALAESLARDGIPGIRFVQNSTILSMETDKQKVLRATTTGIAHAGFQLDAAALAGDIAEAFAKNNQSISIQAPYTQPTVTMTDASGATKTLTLLATGYSDFAGSVPARTANVHKAIEERIRSIVVKKGDVFSLIPALDAPITVEKGWQEALGLFGGGAALTPGAGICQSATTLYRAALLAGLPIVEKKNHSLFVDHYEPLGIGLDATIFPYDVNGKNTAVNLRFKNDTPDDLYIQSHIEGDTVLVQLFGADDGRKALLEGPYFSISKNRPKGEIRPLSNHEIGWVRTINRADGTQVKQPIIATYAKPVWHSMMKKYEDARGMALLVPNNYQ